MGWEWEREGERPGLDRLKRGEACWKRGAEATGWESHGCKCLQGSWRFGWKTNVEPEPKGRDHADSRYQHLVQQIFVIMDRGGGRYRSCPL
jgi:hypothetical protein